MAKRKPKTPAPKPVQTVPQALAWIRSHLTPAQLRGMGHKTPEAALLWFAAQVHAEDLRDLSMRELAALVVGGMGPLTLRDVRYDWKIEKEGWGLIEGSGPFDRTDEIASFFLDQESNDEESDDGEE